MSSDCQDDDELCGWCKKPKAQHNGPCAGALEYSPPPHNFEPPPDHEDIYEYFMVIAYKYPDKKAKELARKTADTFTTSVQHVIESVSLCLAIKHARGRL